MMKPRTLVQLEAMGIRSTPGGGLVECAWPLAQGVRFLCPKCFERNDGAAGTHGIIVWFRDRGVADSALPAGRWIVSGRSLADLTLSPSILLTAGCFWHGYVTCGWVT